MRLTKKQAEILRVIGDWIDRHGQSPTYVEVANAVGVHQFTAYRHIDALVQKGALTRERQKARSIKVVKDWQYPKMFEPREVPPAFGIPANLLESATYAPYVDVDTFTYDSEGLEIFVDPGEADEEAIAEALIALSDMHRAAGGLGLEFKHESTHAFTTAGVPAC